MYPIIDTASLGWTGNELTLFFSYLFWKDNINFIVNILMYPIKQH